MNDDPIKDDSNYDEEYYLDQEVEKKYNKNMKKSDVWSKLKKSWVENKDIVFEAWDMTCDIAGKIGEFENKNIFSKVSTGVQISKKVADIHNIFNKKYDKKYNDSRYFSGNEMLDLIQQTTWSKILDINEGVWNYEIYCLDDDNFLLRRRERQKWASWSVFYFFGDKKKILTYIKKDLEKNYGRSMVFHAGENKFKKFYKDVNFDNKIINDLEEEISQFRAAGYGRSLLIYGPPGTGKSSVAYTLGNRLGSTLILRGISQSGNNATLLDIIRLVDSDILVIDDLDHTGNWEKFLSFLEELRDLGKVVIGTANKVNQLNSAIIRPGRFDKLILISKLDENAVMKLVDQDMEIFNLVKDFPVASIMELMIRVRVQGKEKALANAEDIISRAKALQEEYADL